MVQKPPLRHPRWDPPRDLRPTASQGAARQTPPVPGWAPVSCWPGPRGHGSCARLRHQPVGPVGPSSPSEAGPKGACSRHPRLPATATGCPRGGSGQLPTTRPWTQRLHRGGRDLGAPAQPSAGRLPAARGEPQQPQTETSELCLPGDTPNLGLGEPSEGETQAQQDKVIFYSGVTSDSKPPRVPGGASVQHRSAPTAD